MNPDKITRACNAYQIAHLSAGPKLHPRAYKQPAPRKCDGTMLLRPAGASESVRVPLPAWLAADKSQKRAFPKIHPQGYQQPKPRKDDGTMLVRLNGPDAEPVRIPTPDNFRVVHFPRLEREPLSGWGYDACPVVDAAWREYHARENAGKPCIGTCHIPPVGCSVCAPSYV